MEKKKILCIYPQKPGGEYIASKNICQELLKSKKVRVIVCEIDKYRPVTPRGRLRLLRNLLVNFSILREELSEISRKSGKVDYLYSPFSLLLFLASRLPIYKKTKLIYHFHGFEYGEADKTLFQYLKSLDTNFFIKYFYLGPFFFGFTLLEGYILKNIWKIFVPTDYSRLIIFKRYPFVEKDKVSVILNGYDMTKFYPQKTMKKQKLHHILYVGRLVEEKGVMNLVEAMKNLDDKKYILTILYPTSEDNKFEQKIKLLLGKIKNVMMFKDLPVDKIANFYRKSELAVLPSITFFEQLPLVYLESMACGTPMLVSYKIPGILEWQARVAPNLILSKITPEEIAEKIKEFCQLPRRGRMVIRARCLELAQEFSWKKSAEKILVQVLDKK